MRCAIANYCKRSGHDGDRADSGMGDLTPLFDDADVVSVGFWPHLTVLRDLVNNPMPVSCGEGVEVAVAPGVGSIDALLPLAGFWPSLLR